MKINIYYKKYKKYHNKYYNLIGGGQCSICHSENTNKATCPKNPNAKHPNYKRHYLVKKIDSSTKSNQTKMTLSMPETNPFTLQTKPLSIPKPLTIPKPSPIPIPSPSPSPIPIPKPAPIPKSSIPKSSPIPLNPLTFQNHNGLIYCLQDLNNKIAGFDLDSTLIKYKKRGWTDENDFSMMYDTVKPVLHSLILKGFSIVIFTNQSGLDTKKKADRLSQFKLRLQNIITYLEIPVSILIATNYSYYRKPSIGMWQFLKSNSPLISDKDSFYCGDAYGGDSWGDVDILFAHNINISFIKPEHIFNDQPNTLPPIKQHPFLDYPEIKCDNSVFKEIFKTHTKVAILNIGLPGSGKSVLTQQLQSQYDIEVVSKDQKNDTKSKFIKLVKNGVGIIIDNTNFRRETPLGKSSWGFARDQYINILQSHGYYIIAIWFDIPMEIANYLNYYRANYTDPLRSIVPKVVYHTYNKHFIRPELNEGFNNIIIRNHLCDFKMSAEMEGFIV